jgi:hypothetical protein
MYWGYIKKEDAKDLAKAQRINAYIVMGAMAIIPIIFQFTIIPKLTEIAAEVGYVFPVYSRYYFPIATVLLILMSIVLNNSSEDLENDLKKKLSKYKAGEMILMRKLWDQKFQFKVMGMMFVMMFYLIVSIILPVYQITSSIQ